MGSKSGKRDDLVEAMMINLSGCSLASLEEEARGRCFSSEERDALIQKKIEQLWKKIPGGMSLDEAFEAVKRETVVEHKPNPPFLERWAQHRLQCQKHGWYEGFGNYPYLIHTTAQL